MVVWFFFTNQVATKYPFPLNFPQIGQPFILRHFEKFILISTILLIKVYACTYIVAYIFRVSMPCTCYD